MLASGIVLTLAVLAWFGWRLVQTVARDRGVASRVPPAAAAPGH